MGKVFYIVSIGILLSLALGELGRFRRARRESDQIPYPAGRLARRLGIAACFCIALVTVWLWPAVTPWIQLLLMAFVVALLLAGLVLVWRDLTETSRAIVAESDRLHREAGEQMLRIVHNHRNASHPPKP